MRTPQRLPLSWALPLFVLLGFLGAVSAGNPTVKGLRGRYFAGTTPAGDILLERFEAVDFNWGHNSPHPNLPQDKFSILWEGFVKIPSTGNYTFGAFTDDGFKFFVRGALLFEFWEAKCPGIIYSPPVHFSAGDKVPIVLAFFEAHKKAIAELYWIPPGMTNETTIPLNNLLPPTSNDSFVLPTTTTTTASATTTSVVATPTTTTAIPTTTSTATPSPTVIPSPTDDEVVPSSSNETDELPFWIPLVVVMSIFCCCLLIVLLIVECCWRRKRANQKLEDGVAITPQPPVPVPPVGPKKELDGPDFGAV